MNRPIQLLLVEDSETDIRLTQLAFERSKLESELHVVRDGQAALDYLQRRGGFADAKRPDLVLLDLNLPILSGSEVLARIRDDSGLEKIPVLILTASDAETDIFESFEKQVNCYVTKPADLRRYAGVIEMIEDFWLRSK